MQCVSIIQSNMKQCAYTLTESTMVTPSGSCEGPNVIISFLSAWRLSSLVNGISNQRFRATFVWMLRPNTWKQMCNSNFNHLLWFNHFLLHQFSWTWCYRLSWDLTVSYIYIYTYNNLVNLFPKTNKTRSLNVNQVWPTVARQVQSCDFKELWGVTQKLLHRLQGQVFAILGYYVVVVVGGRNKLLANNVQHPRGARPQLCCTRSLNNAQAVEWVCHN